jgi:hypothetical protein
MGLIDPMRLISLILYERRSRGFSKRIEGRMKFEALSFPGATFFSCPEILWESYPEWDL